MQVAVPNNRIVNIFIRPLSFIYILSRASNLFKNFIPIQFGDEKYRGLVLGSGKHFWLDQFLVGIKSLVQLMSSTLECRPSVCNLWFWLARNVKNMIRMSSQNSKHIPFLIGYFTHSHSISTTMILHFHTTLCRRTRGSSYFPVPPPCVCAAKSLRLKVWIYCRKSMKVLKYSR